MVHKCFKCGSESADYVYTLDEYICHGCLVGFINDLLVDAGFWDKRLVLHGVTLNFVNIV